MRDKYFFILPSINPMPADVLAMQGARASATMLLTKFLVYILVLPPEWLIYPSHLSMISDQGPFSVSCLE